MRLRIDSRKLSVVILAIWVATPGVAESIFDWIRPQRDIECTSIPWPEQLKFRDCELPYLLQHAKRNGPQDRKRLEPAMDRSIWAWLGVDPIADCADLPDPERAKFSCPGASSEGQPASEILADFRRWRDGLRSRKAALDTQRRAIEEAEASLASPEDVRRRDAMLSLERRITQKEAKEALTIRLANTIRFDSGTRLDLARLRLMVVARTTLVRERGGLRDRALGEALAGDVVLVVGEAQTLGDVAIVHPRFGEGKIAFDVLTRLDDD